MQNRWQIRGKRGEQLAEEFLTKIGYFIIARNFKSKLGEIDLIAVHKNTLIFIEVKTRSSLEFGQPYEAVGKHKLRSISNTGKFFVSIHQDLPKSQQIDVISILTTQDGKTKHIEHLQNVTG